MEDFKVFQIDCKVYLLKDITFHNLFSEIATYVDKTLSTDKDLLDFHRATGYKYYVLSGFKELEKDKCYKAGKLYTFSIRCIKEELCNFFLRKLGEGKTETMKGLITTMKVIPRRPIEKLYTITPALIKLEGEGYWRGTLSLDQYEKRLNDNSVKKFQQLTGVKIDDNFRFYDGIKFLNQKPISNYYAKKDISLLGDKLELYISNDEQSQKIAYMLLGTGVLENNSRSYGYLNYKSM